MAAWLLKISRVALSSIRCRGSTGKGSPSVSEESELELEAELSSQEGCSSAETPLSGRDVHKPLEWCSRFAGSGRNHLPLDHASMVRLPFKLYVIFVGCIFFWAANVNVLDPDVCFFGHESIWIQPRNM